MFLPCDHTEEARADGIDFTHVGSIGSVEAKNHLLLVVSTGALPVDFILLTWLNV